MDFEFNKVGFELVRTRCSYQDEAMMNFQNVLDLQQLSEEQAEKLVLSMLGELNREEQVGIKYRYDQRTRKELILIPREWIETNIASTGFEKQSIESFDEVFGDRELQSQFEKEEEEWPRRETLTQIGMGSKKPETTCGE